MYIQQVPEIRNLPYIQVSVYLKDVAKVDFGYLGLRSFSFDRFSPCIYLEVMKQSGKNTIEVVKKVKNELLEIENDYQRTIKFTYVSDQ